MLSELVLAAVLVSKDGVATLYTDKPCEVAKVLERFPQHRLELRAGSLNWEGRTVAACWVAGKNMVFMLDEDGDLSRIPKDYFLQGDTL